MSPCDWDVDPSPLCADWATFTPAVQAAAIRLATSYLWAATGRRFGPCPIEVRPVQGRGADDAYRAYPVWPGQESGTVGPYLFAGTWRNCGCGSSCCCAPECAIVLRGPVNEIVEVVVEGVVIPPTDYRVDVTQGAYHLVRLAGVCWPTCQDFQTEDGFVVTYDIGVPVPAVLEDAAALLACEYGSHLTGGACRLPVTMTRLSRQGVEVEVEPPGDGVTGIREVDDIVVMFNPSKRRSAPMILSPDLPELCDRITPVQGGS